MVIGRQYDRATSSTAAGMRKRLFSHWGGSDCLLQAVRNFINLADDSGRVPKLSNGRHYKQFEISNVEWTQLGLIHEVLKVRVCSIHRHGDQTFNVNPIQPWSRKSLMHSKLSRVKLKRPSLRQ